MIEPIMYFGIGFLAAALIGLVVVPLVHGRAVRLTMRRLEAATPLSMAEIQADKDQLRAEFAMSTRRLEMSVEQLKTRSTSQLAELGKKGDAINRLKIELGEKTAAIFALEARDKSLRDQLRATEEEFAVKTSDVHDAQRALSDKQADLAKLMGELDERSILANSQKIEIVALKTQVDALKERLDGAGRELKTVEDRRDAERIELKAATQKLSEERGKVENLGRRATVLEQQLAAQTKEAEILGRRAQDFETRLGEQSRLLNQSEFELKQLRRDIEAARKVEGDLRAALIETFELSYAKSQDRERSAAGGDRPRQRRARPVCPRSRHDEARNGRSLGVRACGECVVTRKNKRRRS
jgi:chromosome segregation ATPase